MTVTVELPLVAANGFVPKATTTGTGGPPQGPAPQPFPVVKTLVPEGYSYAAVTVPPPVALEEAAAETVMVYVVLEVTPVTAYSPLTVTPPTAVAPENVT